MADKSKQPRFKSALPNKVRVDLGKGSSVLGEVIKVSESTEKYLVRHPAPWGGTTSGWYPKSKLSVVDNF